MMARIFYFRAPGRTILDPELMRAFVFMRKDPKFTVKFAILSAAMFIPVVGWILALGYCIMLYRNYIDGKDDEMILPEWEDFGNYVFKGVSLATALFCYILLFSGLGLVLALACGAPLLVVNAVGGEGGSIFTSIVLFIISFVVSFLALLVSGVAFSFFSESLTVSDCFKVLDIIRRVTGLGANYYVFCAIIAFVFSLSFKILWFNGFFLWILASALQAYLSIVSVYGLASLVQGVYHPSLYDPTDIHIERSAHMELDPTTDEDEYGHSKPGKHGASYWAGHRPDTSITWSTDSDEAE